MQTFTLTRKEALYSSDGYGRWSSLQEVVETLSCRESQRLVGGVMNPYFDGLLFRVELLLVTEELEILFLEKMDFERPMVFKASNITVI